MSRKSPQIKTGTNKKPLKSEEQPAKSKKKKKSRKNPPQKPPQREERRDWGEGEDERLAKENREF